MNNRFATILAGVRAGIAAALNKAATTLDADSLQVDTVDTLLANVKVLRDIGLLDDDTIPVEEIRRRLQDHRKSTSPLQDSTAAAELNKGLQELSSDMALAPWVMKKLPLLARLGLCSLSVEDARQLSHLAETRPELFGMPAVERKRDGR